MGMGAYSWLKLGLIVPGWLSCEGLVCVVVAAVAAQKQLPVLQGEQNSQGIM
jgi:hypothetical protein